MVFRIVNEDIILESFDKKYFSVEQIKYFKSKLEMILLRDTQILWDALERDRKGIVKELKNGLLLKTKILHSKNVSLTQKIIDNFEKIKYMYDKEFYDLNTEEELTKLESHLQITPKADN
jgi:hypothetical protein